ncbi:SHOCT domain-containing protein [Herbiconiux sp. SYSU D00978]|uniref:SHOCT domain-containing protein n=1 Tax=Herbiconiux sp. SYSU D00978 TaxID=2812562 RepID=UPI001A975F0B|nr:SHOCT domain-containing protein [Herbiconiux sp. SYSU D00978]
MLELITRFGPGFGPGFSPFWLIGPIFWLLVLATLIVLAVVFARRNRQLWQHGGPSAWRAAASAEQVLGERFARGEIDETEYRQRLDVLRAGRPQPQK